MGELSVRIKIADREYPMKVEASDEARIRNAGKQINERMKAYRERFGIDDKQDLLAMVAFDCLVDTIQPDEGNVTDEGVVEKISALNHLISQAL
ncbi:MAG: cell division protein ZapA [Bacteroidota bacterium]|jgi:cell division protein ZapA|nr:cell division protein ZapA [Bacteroidota bacterium]